MTVESIQNRIYHRLNQLQIESTTNRIQPTIESTYCCKVKDSQSQRSKEVKPSSAVGFGPLAIAPPVSACSGPIYGAGKLGRELDLISWKLRAGSQAAN